MAFFGRNKNTPNNDMEGVSEEDVPFWMQPRWFIPTGFIALIVIVGVVFTILRPFETGNAGSNVDANGTGPAPITTSTPEPTIPAEPATDTSESICGLPAGDQSIPAGPPTDTKWVYLPSKLDPTVEIALPNSNTAGPGKVEAAGYHRSCFAHSPLGAIYAAANMGLLWSVGEAGWTFENLDAPGAGRDVVLGWGESLTKERSVPAQLSAFNLEVWTGDRAVVDISMVASMNRAATFQLTLQWMDGDWKAVVPSTGLFNQAPPTTQLIPWKGAV